jgi:putative membrane protein
MKLILRWIAAAAAVACAAWLVPGITYQGGLGGLLVVALILGLVNALVRPLLRWLSCGLIVLTLGLFLFIINALMLLLAAAISRQVGIDFAVNGFVAALVGSVVITLVSWVFSLALGERR